MRSSFARFCRLALALHVLALIGCAAPATSVRTTPGARTIRAVTFKGNPNVSGEDLLEGMGSRPGAEFEPSQLELDTAQIIPAHYAQHGYFRARVTSATPRHVGSDLVDLAIVIDEGQPVRVESIGVTVHEPGIEPATAEEALGLRKGAIFIHHDYLQGRERVRTWLVNRGYRFAVVSGDIDVDRKLGTAKVALDVFPGKRVYFGKTTVVGAARVPVDSVLARVAWCPGDVYDPSLIALTEQRLYALGRFSSVRFDYPREGTKEHRSDVLDITVHVTESTRHEFRLGFGVGVDSAHVEVRGRTGYQERGWVWPMTTLRLDLRPSYSFFYQDTEALGFGIQAIAGLEHEDFLVPRLRFTNQLDYSVEVLEAYSLQGPRVKLGLDRAFLRDRLVLGAGWTLRYPQKFFNIDAAITPGLQDLYGMPGTRGADYYYRAGFFEQSIAYDRRDNPLDTRKGFQLQLRAEEGGAFAGGAFEYVKLSPELSAYVPIGSRVVVGARAELGWAFETGTPVPITQRYFAGGPSSQRGFALQRLSPVADPNIAHGVPIGGQGMLEASLEARIDLFTIKGFPAGVALFLDGADVTLAPEELDPGHLHWATGAELRLRTPVGAVRVGFGRRLNRLGAGEPDAGEKYAFFLGLGDAF